MPRIERIKEVLNQLEKGNLPPKKKKELEKKVAPRRSAGGSFIDSPTREKTSSRLDGTTETDQLVPKGGASPVPLKLYGNR